jgi:hypothetical protein
MTGVWSRICRCQAPVIVAVLALSACGGGNTGTGPAGEPTASAPEATAPPADATQPGTTAVTPPTTTTQPSHIRTTPARTQTTPAEGGGEEAVRVPVSFTVAPGGALEPPVITAPPFLAVELSLTSRDGRPHTLVLETVPPRTLHVAADAREAVRIPGLRAGRYVVMLDGQRVGALLAGGEVGP